VPRSPFRFCERKNTKGGKHSLVIKPTISESPGFVILFSRWYTWLKSGWSKADVSSYWIFHWLSLGVFLPEQHCASDSSSIFNLFISIKSFRHNLFLISAPYWFGMRASRMFLAFQLSMNTIYGIVDLDRYLTISSPQIFTTLPWHSSSLCPRLLENTKLVVTRNRVTGSGFLGKPVVLNGHVINVSLSQVWCHRFFKTW